MQGDEVRERMLRVGKVLGVCTLGVLGVLLLLVLPATVSVAQTADWTQQAKLIASDAAAGDEAGASVSIAGDTLTVGSHLDDGGAGSAYVFQRSGTSWSQQAKLTGELP